MIPLSPGAPNPRRQRLTTVQDHAHQYYRFRNEPTVYEAQKHTAEYLRAHLNRARYQFVAAPDNRSQKYFKHKRGAVRHDQELMEEWELSGGAVDEEDRLASMHDKSEKNWEPALYTRVLIETLPPQGAWTWDEVRAYEEEVEAARIYEEELRVYEEAVRVHNEQVRVYEEKMEKKRAREERRARRREKQARRLEEEARLMQSDARRAEDRARRLEEEREESACHLEQGASRAEVEAGKALSDPQEKCTFAGGLLTSCRTLLSGW
ncbi:hypothetical protein BD626DRAFT_515489 [Schizophyllum amplum]|uniref:Uncharacterized protein n=1 Tax=Schizophyllum amplum TaxID=97359 RepID=A0A550BXH2_9AGAR|nr:hypothetical protein BD626DRAFT_515489 [Auriculariopsis ampla]